jgi:glycerol-3-phosphate dehydrogenase
MPHRLQKTVDHGSLMTSERQIAANRLNGRKSPGLCTTAGKSTASRNAARHGLAAIRNRQPIEPADLERLAKALCGNDDDPAVYKQAIVIASHELVLRAISAQQIAVVERLRDPSVIALAKGDNRLQLAKARFLKGRLAYSALIAHRDRLLEKYKNELKPFQYLNVVSEIEEAFPPHLEELLEEKESELGAEEIRQQKGRFYDEECIKERDESAAMEKAASDLLRLNRYERRAWSRQRRAIFAFINLKLMKQMDLVKTPN